MVLQIDLLLRYLEDERRKGQRIVFTNGCFDILHVGHTRYLAQAKALGDILVVGVNTDTSVKRLKGNSRPVVVEEDRAELLDCIKHVDYVVLFDDDTAENLVKKIRPDIYVKGGDYNLDNNPEAKIVVGYGGEARFIPLAPGKSTTSIISKMAK